MFLRGPCTTSGPVLAGLKFDLNSFYDVNNITHWEGKRHGLIVQLNVNSGVYNKSAFQQAGVRGSPPLDWTWDGYLEAARRLNKPQDFLCGAPTRCPGYPYAWYWSANVPYMDAKGTRTSWDSAPSREILQWLTRPGAAPPGWPPPPRSSRTRS